MVAPTLAYAVPACPTPSTMTQPDGTEVTLVLHGDEFLNYSTTADGYTVMQNEAGYFVYAEKNADGVLKATSQVAHDTKFRTSTEKRFLSKVKKGLVPVMTQEMMDNRANTIQGYADNKVAMSKYFQQSAANNGKKKLYDYKKFKGLVILVEFNDCKFIRDDAHELFSNMASQKNYKGFMTTNVFSELVPYTGSVRDYYYDNSLGKFDPEFDVYGPVTIDCAQTYVNQTARAQEVVKMALKAANDSINYADYDTDGNREVDMVYFIFAGGGSNYSGNNASFIWPHASSIYGVTYDGVTFGRYACSTELYGRPDSNIIDGIGTVCHEFSHVLGLMDEYDTDYASSGGQSVTPNTWSVMAGGSYLNKARTPAGYSAYERYAIGFKNPVLIEENGEYTLNKIEETGESYRIDSSIKNEYFLFENRQNVKWNGYLPGHGMLVFRVDSTSSTPWTSNKVNANPDHNYYELIRAKASKSGANVTDSGGDPFPGTGKVTGLNSETSPNLNSWTGTETEMGLYNITESPEGIITFTTNVVKAPTEIEDFEEMTLTSADTTGVEGKFCKWDLTKAKVEMPDAKNCNGKRAISIVKRGLVQTSKIASHVRTAQFTFVNPTLTSANVRFYYSVNDGVTWVSVKNLDGLDISTVGANTTENLVFPVNLDEGAMFRISESTGSATSKCYIDDVTFKYSEKVSGIDDVTVDHGEAMSVSRSANIVTVNGAEETSPVRVYGADGMLISEQKAREGSVEIALPSPGFYIISQGAKSVKIIY